MRPSKFLLSFVVLSWVAVAFAGDAKSELRAEYDHLVAVMKKNDPQIAVKFFKSSTTADFSYTSSKGVKMNVAQLIEQVKRQMAVTQKVTKLSVSITRVEVSGNTAVVTNSGVFEATIQGPDKKPHLLHDVSISSDTWVKTSKGWKIRAVKEVSEKSTIDGQDVAGG